MEAVGHPVERLKLIRFGSLELGQLKPGEWRDLSPGEIQNLTERPVASKRKSRRRR